MKQDLFKENNYSASTIEVLEGLEPVRHRPGMYIGGTDRNALHHLAIEIIDNCMDEVVAKQLKLMWNEWKIILFVLAITEEAYQ